MINTCRVSNIIHNVGNRNGRYGWWEGGVAVGGGGGCRLSHKPTIAQIDLFLLSAILTITGILSNGPSNFLQNQPVNCKEGGGRGGW